MNTNGLGASAPGPFGIERLLSERRTTGRQLAWNRVADPRHWYVPCSGMTAKQASACTIGQNGAPFDMMMLDRELNAALVPEQVGFIVTTVPRAARLATGELQLEVIDSFAGLTHLEEEWNDLFERAGRAEQVFQTHGFVVLFAKTYDLGQSTRGRNTRASGCTCSLAIVTARREGRLVLVWPLVVRRELGLDILSWLGEPVAQYGDVVLDRSEPARETLLAAWEHVRRHVQPDAVRLRKVRADAAVMPLFAALGATAREVVEAPCITLAAGGSSFEDRQSGKARKNRRRLLRRLEEQGAVAFEELGPDPAARAAIIAGLADKREWLAQRGLFSAALADARFDRFMTAAICEAHPDTGGTAFSLTLDDRPIALALGFRVKNRLMLHLISYAADVEKHGAGVLNLEAILRQAEAEGLDAVDLLPPKADYKLDWADTSVEVGDYGLGVTARGKVWRALFDGIVRLRGKQVMARLPRVLRRRLLPRAVPAARGGVCTATNL